MRIAIGGAGIAGLAAAAFFARVGHNVLVYDKAPKPTPVGSGLIIQPTGQAALAALGSLDDLAKCGARLERLDGRLECGRKVLDVRYDALGPDIFGLSVHRSALFDCLHDAAREAGVIFSYGQEVVGAESVGDSVRLRFADGEVSPSAALVVDALGLRTPFVERENCYLDYGALWANVPFPSVGGFSERALAQRYQGASISAGVMPIGALPDSDGPMAAFFWTLRPQNYESWLMTPLPRWKDRVLTLWPEAAPVLDQISSHEDFILAQYAHHTAPAPVNGRIVHIGDAWHAASPQLGQGANMALLDAWALSLALERHETVEAALAAFAKMRGRHVWLYQTISRLFTPVYQSDSKLLPALRDKLAEPLSDFWFMPKLLASMVSGTLGEPLKGLKPS
ncbi:FAD-dependent oxidoreductase [Hyphococcus sp.]|uniref:FAD-dependent oxidoreductase n=1 Tax=Hyphococcus sp. TaxID=2038636 RepID=UPI0035C6FF5C